MKKTKEEKVKKKAKEEKVSRMIGMMMMMTKKCSQIFFQIYISEV